MAYRATVSDEMTFARVLDSLAPLDRDAFDRVLQTGGFRTGVTREELRDARSEGFSAGLASGRASQQPTQKP